MATLLVASPLTVALLTALHADAPWLALCPGRAWDVLPQNVVWPASLVVVRVPQDLAGFGTGSLPAVEVRHHVFSKQGSMKEAHQIMNRTIELWKHVPIDLAAAGFDHCGGAFWCDEVTPIPSTVVNGVQCHELVGMFRGYFEKVG